MSRLNRIAAGLVLSSLAACAHPDLRLYDGPPRPSGEVAVVTMPEQLEIVTINGVDVPGARGMAAGDKRLELVPGHYDLLVYYREFWEQNDAGALRSDPARFSLDALAGHRYRIDYEHPHDAGQARLLAADFHGWIADEAGGARVPSADSGLRFKSGIVAQLTRDASLQQDGGKSGDAPSVAPLPAAAVTASSATAETATAAPAAPALAQTPTVDADAKWLPLMKGWWQQATPEERREFLRWVGEQR